MITPRPTIGRIVHYVSHGTPPRPDGSQAFASTCRTALVTEVGESWGVGLCAVNPTGLFFHPISDGPCVFDPNPNPAGGTWHWPEGTREAAAGDAIPAAARVNVTTDLRGDIQRLEDAALNPAPAPVIRSAVWAGGPGGESVVHTTNDYLVGVRAGDIVLTTLAPNISIPTDRALRLAAWIVALADPTHDHAEFRRVLEAVEAT